MGNRLPVKGNVISKAILVGGKCLEKCEGRCEVSSPPVQKGL